MRHLNQSTQEMTHVPRRFREHQVRSRPRPPTGEPPTSTCDHAPFPVMHVRDDVPVSRSGMKAGHRSGRIDGRSGDAKLGTASSSGSWETAPRRCPRRARCSRSRANSAEAALGSKILQTGFQQVRVANIERY